MEVKISKEIKDICKEFADNSVGTSAGYYNNRNQSNPFVIKNQIYTGKIGEFAAHLYLKDFLPNITAPDCNIYTSKNKSFDTDLKSEDMRFHIKSQSKKSATQYGSSWTFQNGSKKTGAKGHIDTEVFGSDTTFQFVCFVQVDDSSSIANVLAIVPLEVLHQNKLFKDPVLEKLKGIKQVVYYDDLKAYEDLFVFKTVIKEEEEEFRI